MLKPALFLWVLALALAATASAYAGLSITNLEEIRVATATAIDHAVKSLPPKTAQEEIDSAAAIAIASILQSEMVQHRDIDPGYLTEAVVVAAGDTGASLKAIGTGMAQAALQARSDVGIAIARAVGSTAPTRALQVFEATTSASPYGAALAAAAADAEVVESGALSSQA